jgi:hypothetical protein
MFGESTLAVIAQLTPAIIGITEVVKRVIPSRFAPLVSLLLGMASGFFYAPEQETAQKILAGVVLGLTASGIYSGVKNTAQISGADSETNESEEETDVKDLHKIMGKAEIPKEQFKRRLSKLKEPPKLNCPPDALVDLYYTIGKKEGVRADYALCQAMLETGNFQYGGIVLWNQNNYAGLGATGTTEAGGANTFETPRDGVTAHIQHLKGYASRAKLKLPLKDQRYRYISLRSAPYLEWLAIPNNPNGNGWAGDKDYCGKILKIYEDLSK